MAAALRPARRHPAASARAASSRLTVARKVRVTSALASIWVITVTDERLTTLAKRRCQRLGVGQNLFLDNLAPHDATEVDAAINDVAVTNSGVAGGDTG